MKRNLNGCESFDLFDCVFCQIGVIGLCVEGHLADPALWLEVEDRSGEIRLSCTSRRSPSYNVEKPCVLRLYTKDRRNGNDH